MNSAKLLKNTLIFGGVLSTEDQPPLDALKVFLKNFLQIEPADEDMWDIAKLGIGYTQWVAKKKRNCGSFPQ